MIIYSQQKITRLEGRHRESFDISSFHHILCLHFGAPKWVGRQNRCWFWGIFEACWLGDGDSRWWILFPNQETLKTIVFFFVLHRKWKTEHISRTEQWKRSPSWFMFFFSGVMLPNILGIIGFYIVTYCNPPDIFRSYNPWWEHIVGTHPIYNPRDFILGCKTWRCIPGLGKVPWNLFQNGPRYGLHPTCYYGVFHTLTSSIFGGLSPVYSHYFPSIPWWLV